MNKKIIVESVLILLLFTVLFLELFWSEYSVDIILRAVLLLIAIALGLYVIKNFYEELEYKNEIKALRKKVERANKELQRLDSAKSEFISIASHQLRTPLTATKGYTSLILEGTYGEISDSVKNALGKVYTANERLIQLVEDLLNISRIESGKMKYNFKRINVFDIMASLDDTFKLMAQKKNIEFKMKMPNKEIMVFVDPLKIREVISNLIDNAIKYTEKGFVHVNVECDEENIKIIIKDSGIGISKKNQEHLFTKFSRGKDSARLYMEGTGLGLFVGKNIVEAHNGRIIVKSDGIKKGSCFTLELPKVKK